ncbi:MAG: hypothetical protein WAO07_09045, partial [Desulfobacterales bacterium]
MEDLGKNEESGQLSQETMSDNEPADAAGLREAEATPTGAADAVAAAPVESAEEQPEPEQDGQKSGDSMESLMDMYEESFKRFAEG